MGRVTKSNTKTHKTPRNAPTLLAIEDRLRIFANIIVDRIIEEQLNRQINPFGGRKP